MCMRDADHYGARVHTVHDPVFKSPPLFHRYCHTWFLAWLCTGLTLVVRWAGIACVVVIRSSSTARTAFVCPDTWSPASLATTPRRLCMMTAVPNARIVPV